MKICHQSDREAWLAARLGYCTASEIHVASGRHEAECAALRREPYMTRAQLVDSKRGLFVRESQSNEDTELGLLMEDGLAKLVRKLWGWPVEHHGWLTSDDACPDLAATPDLVMQTPWGPAVVDMKVTVAQAQEDCAPGRGGKPSTARFANGCPEDYATQLQAQMACLGRDYKWGAILALHVGGGRKKLRAYPVRRSEAIIAEIRDVARALMSEARGENA